MRPITMRRPDSRRALRARSDASVESTPIMAQGKKITWFRIAVGLDGLARLPRLGDPNHEVCVIVTKLRTERIDPA